MVEILVFVELILKYDSDKLYNCVDGYIKF